jgi:hypothetical protein
MSRFEVMPGRENRMVMLQELLEKVIYQDVLRPSRIAPLRTAVKQYAAMLGKEACHCPPNLYQLPDDLRNQLIESKTQATLSVHTIRNLKNNISLLLRIGVQRGYLQVPERRSEPLSWSTRRRLKGGRDGWRPIARPESVAPVNRWLLPLPPILTNEFHELYDWFTKPFVPDRPARVQKRPATMQDQLRVLQCMAGFLAYEQHRDPETLTIRDLIAPTTVQAYIAWWIERRGQVTETMKFHLIVLRTVAQYWLKDEQATAGISRLMRTLPAPTSVRDKQSRMLSPAQLDQIGQAQYPYNARRLLEDKGLERYLHKHLDNPVAPPSKYDKRFTWRRIAVWVEYSLILRFLVRIPLRIRNIVEMQLGRNLVQLPNGRWQLQFRGTELKVARRDGRENELVRLWPEDLQPLLEEWLTVWRPKLVSPAGHKFVFCSSYGRPYREGALSQAIKRTTYVWSGIAVNPHLIRDIWATEYLKSGGKTHVAARLLGNTVQTVHHHYAHLLDQDADREADAWIQTRLNGKKSN